MQGRQQAAASRVWGERPRPDALAPGSLHDVTRCLRVTRGGRPSLGGVALLQVSELRTYLHTPRFPCKGPEWDVI